MVEYLQLYLTFSSVCHFLKINLLKRLKINTEKFTFMFVPVISPIFPATVQYVCTEIGIIFIKNPNHDNQNHPSVN